MNNPKFSIIATLSEALRLGARYVGLILLLSALTTAPSALLQFGLSLVPLEQVFLNTTVSIVGAIALFVVSAMKVAAILGVLKRPENDLSVWPGISISIRTYTWTLVRLSILLTLIACLFTVPIGMLISAFVLSPNFTGNYLLQGALVFVAILYLVFVKYALADPLVVVEGMNARDSLKGSWMMTRGRFGYVLGCYVFLGTAEYFISTLLVYFEPSNGFNLINVADAMATSLFECFWILMAWCMYQRIKALEPEPVTAEVSA